MKKNHPQSVLLFSLLVAITPIAFTGCANTRDDIGLGRPPSKKHAQVAKDPETTRPNFTTSERTALGLV